MDCGCKKRQKHVYEVLGSVKIFDEKGDCHNQRFAGMTGEAVSVRNGKSHIHYVYAKTEISDGPRHEFQVATLIEDPIGEIEEDK